MADQRFRRDANHVPVIGGVTDDANEYVRELKVDPVTDRLKTNTTVTGTVDTSEIPMAVKIQTDGTATYVGMADPGTLQAEAKWQAFKYDSGVLTFADGNANFDNVATDLTSLSYS